MGFKSIALVATTMVLSTSVNAAIVNADWQTDSDNLITRVTGTGPGGGLEWLDLTATTSRSYADISSKFGTGQEFEGWRYATTAEISDFFDAFGGDSNYYNAGWSTQNSGLFDSIAPYWGDTSGDGYSYFITADQTTLGMHKFGYIYDSNTHSRSLDEDYLRINDDEISDTNYLFDTGSALVRLTVVPIPAAIWLFGSGLIGLIGIARRKKS
ncbi:MAG: VPLPA-CTERM sorting domain-containing protein [Proteobacteria bacterium]|nr:VPLPA-CTERM sorting domain-containing protein [Pseudomonadota bacterium]